MQERDFYARPPATQAEDDELLRTWTRETPFAQVLAAYQRSITTGHEWPVIQARIEELFPEIDGLEQEARTRFADGRPGQSWDDLHDALALGLWSRLSPYRSAADRPLLEWVAENYLDRVLRVFGVSRGPR